MNEKTQASYRTLAAHFYEKRLDGQPPTPKRLADALKACAGEYRPAYWRKLRNALAFDQREKGFTEAATRLDATVNPLTAEGASGEGVKAKQPRSKRVTQADEERLMKHFAETATHSRYQRF